MLQKLYNSFRPVPSTVILCVDSCRQAFVELREGATVNSELINTFCKEMPGSQYTRGNMLYIRFFTNVTDPKNGFKAVVSIGKIYPFFHGSDNRVYKRAICLSPPIMGFTGLEFATMVALRNDPGIRCLEPTMVFRLVKLSYPIIGQDRLLGLQEFGAPRISRHLAYEGGKVVSPMHCSPSPPGYIPDTHLC